MIKKILIILSVIVLLLTVLYSAIKNTYHIDEKALVSLVKPPSEDITERLPQGSNLTLSQLKSKGDFTKSPRGIAVRKLKKYLLKFKNAKSK